MKDQPANRYIFNDNMIQQMHLEDNFSYLLCVVIILRKKIPFVGIFQLMFLASNVKKNFWGTIVCIMLRPPFFSLFLAPVIPVIDKMNKKTFFSVFSASGLLLFHTNAIFFS